MRVDLVLNGALGWNVGLGWVENAVNLGVFNGLHFASSGNALAILQALANGAADVALFLCADQHMAWFQDTEEKRRALRAIPATTVCIANESVIHTPFVEHNVPKGKWARDAYDHILTQDERDLDFFSGGHASAAFCPQAADSGRFQPATAMATATDTGMDAEAMAPGRGAVFFGQSAPYFDNPAFYYDRRRILAGLDGFAPVRRIERYIPSNRDPAALAGVIARSWITLCLPTNVGGCTNRVFEGAACGSLVLHYRLHEQPLTAALLRDRETCMLFDAHDVPGLKRIITELLEDEPLRDRIVETARRDFLERHSIKQRLRQILHYVASGSRAPAVPLTVPDDFFPDFVKAERLTVS